jgi:hypothetical protein
MPKSSSRTSPAGVTMMFDGLRSRCTIRFACAWLTAAQTWAKHASTALSSDTSRCSRHQSVIGLALDVLQRQVRLAVVAANAGVQQSRDVRVRQAREDLLARG